MLGLSGIRSLLKKTEVHHNLFLNLRNLSKERSFVTDVTNASRTMLMNIKTLQWDPNLCKFFDINPDFLPAIKSSAEIYGHLGYEGCPLPETIPICGCLGDQQAALVGQKCLEAGMAKNTYGTGCFMLYNVGNEVIYSRHGLLSTVAYKLGPTSPPVYALEYYSFFTINAQLQYILILNLFFKNLGLNLQ